LADPSTSKSSEPIPFGALEYPPGYTSEGERGTPRAAPREASREERHETDGAAPLEKGERKDWRKPENRRGSARRGGRRRHRRHPDAVAPGGSEPPGESGTDRPPAPSLEERNGAPESAGAGEPSAPSAPAGLHGASAGASFDPRRGRRRRRRRLQHGSPQGPQGSALAGVATEARPAVPAEGGRRDTLTEVSGMLVLEKGGYGFLRREENQFLPGRDEVFVPPPLVARFKLREGSLVAGRAGRGSGPAKLALQSVETVDGREPHEVANVVSFKKLTSIDPDFHYAVGDITNDVSMRILDVVCPVGRGTRGLIVAPPRSGKTILMRKFAQAIEQGYPDVVLMVLLVDERPEEATEWRRSTKGQVFVSTNDEGAKNHVQLAEAVWKRCTRLVELGQDVIVLLDSITRLARAYNSLEGGSGRTLSGGLDSRTMERPRAFFGSARNTETAGSLTILGTTLVETGSRLDQVVFEEFKGTGNMELVLSRKLADRRIFPAIDIERSGTRKEEKLISARRLKQIHVLRRVLLKMNFIEAMELLVTKLEDVEKTDDFLKRFEVDPEA